MFVIESKREDVTSSFQLIIEVSENDGDHMEVQQDEN